jgi:hypothetical protein
MSFTQFADEDDQSYPDVVTLFDERGKTLDCYVENILDLDDATYLLLLPIDSPVVILMYDPGQEDEEVAETIILEDPDEIEEVFGDAKAVLGELNLSLQKTAFTLTIRGELPPIEEENIISLEMDEDDEEIEAEDLQFLASFYHLKQKYSICTPLSPLLFVAESEDDGHLSLLPPDHPLLQSILEELLFEESE